MAGPQIVNDAPTPGWDEMPGLGVVSIGPLVIAAPAGVQEWSAEIDLRPERDQVVSLHGRVDPSTGVASWTVTPLTASI